MEKSKRLFHIELLQAFGILCVFLGHAIRIYYDGGWYFHKTQPVLMFDIIDKLTTANGVFIKGIVSQVDEYWSSYKSITYWISDDGTTTKQLQAYSGKGLDGADFTDINGISVDDQVIICGDLKKYSGTYEFDKKDNIFNAPGEENNFSDYYFNRFMGHTVAVYTFFFIQISIA